MKVYLVVVALLLLAVVPASAYNWTALGDNWANWSCGDDPIQDHAANGSSYPCTNAGDGMGFFWLNNNNGGWIQYDNTAHICYSKLRIQGAAGDNTTFICNGHSVQVTSSYTNISDSGCGSIYCEVAEPQPPVVPYGRIVELQMEDGKPDFIPDFVGSPLQGSASLYVMFNDTSQPVGGIASCNWSASPSTGVLWDNTSSCTPGTLFTQPGNYTISHGVTTTWGESAIVNKTNYVTVYNATTDYFTTGFAAMDEPRWVQLAGATINLLDVENNSWKNISSSATGYEEITTLSNHTISAYASMLGYDDAELLSQSACNRCTYPINMYPTGYDNVTEGNVTLYVHVYGSDTTSLPGAYVNLAYRRSGDTSQHNEYQTTDVSGFAKFVVPNQTTIYIQAEKAGYARAGTTLSSGNGNGGDASVTTEITLQRQYVTTAPTITGTGGTVVTTAPTVDPYPCDADHPANCQRKQTDMANILIEYGPMLVLFFIALTVIGGVKQIGR